MNLAITPVQDITPLKEKFQKKLSLTFPHCIFEYGIENEADILVRHYTGLYGEEVQAWMFDMYSCDHAKNISILRLFQHMDKEYCSVYGTAFAALCFIKDGEEGQENAIRFAENIGDLSTLQQYARHDLPERLKEYVEGCIQDLL